MNLAFISGFFLSLSLIIAIGPQNAFVLRQGLLRRHVFPVALFCSISDIILIALGVFGFGAFISQLDYLSKYMYLFGGIWLIGYDGQDKSHSTNISLLKEIHNIIDTMPIRKKEMTEQNEKCN